MADEREFIKKRLAELAKKSYSSSVFTFTDFLGLDELSAFSEIKSSLGGIRYTEFGGAEGTERVMIRFGDEEELGWCEDFPIVILKTEPKAKKWADKLTHRDLLGALMSLGVERAMLGDIVIRDDAAYIFVKERIAPFILEGLTRAKHTDLITSVASELPEGELFKTEERTVQCLSVRADAVVARVFSLSREDAQRLFSSGLVFVDGRLAESVSRELRVGETVSVRGKGRFIFCGKVGTSKKGKQNLLVKLYV